MEDKTLSAEPPILNSTTDDLALRAAPDLNANLLCRLKVLTPLKSLETRDATLGKLGVEGQWLHVQSFDGTEGYTAAWYLKVADAMGPNTAMPESAPSPENLPSSPAENVPLVVKVIADQLALRTEPCIDDANLLLRFPVGTLLTTIDPQTKQKLGVVDQWLKVKDDAGHEGYVAAWYVSL